MTVWTFQECDVNPPAPRGICISITLGCSVYVGYSTNGTASDDTSFSAFPDIHTQLRQSRWCLALEQWSRPLRWLSLPVRKRSTTCSSNGTFAPELPASCQPVVCFLLLPVHLRLEPLRRQVLLGHIMRILRHQACQLCHSCLLNLPIKVCHHGHTVMLRVSSVSAGLQICSWTRWIIVLSNRRLSLNQRFQVKKCALCMHVATSDVFLHCPLRVFSKRSLGMDSEGACWLLFLSTQRCRYGFGCLLAHARPELRLLALPGVLRVRFFLMFAH